MWNDAFWVLELNKQEVEIKSAEFEFLCSIQAGDGADLYLGFVAGCRLMVPNLLWKLLRLFQT